MIHSRYLECSPHFKLFDGKIFEVNKCWLKQLPTTENWVVKPHFQNFLFKPLENIFQDRWIYCKYGEKTVMVSVLSLVNRTWPYMHHRTSTRDAKLRTHKFETQNMPRICGIFKRQYNAMGTIQGAKYLYMHQTFHFWALEAIIRAWYTYIKLWKVAKMRLFAF